MTDTEINIAIAEACGWKYMGEDAEHVKHWMPPAFANAINEMAWEEIVRHRRLHSPDYCHDLNAMHEVEETIINGNDQTDEYLTHLHRLLDCDCEWELATAKASQRAEAFLRTIGKWKE